MQLRNKLRLLVSVGSVAAAMTIGLVATSVSGAASAKVSTSSNTITFAEAPGAAPNYIFPYLGCQYFSVATLSQFQELTYRPVYWFGTPGSSAVDYNLSPAQAARLLQRRTRRSPST
jgi:peptide/nickel transport system substrate-binding protein